MNMNIWVWISEERKWTKMSQMFLWLCSEVSTLKTKGVGRLSILRLIWTIIHTPCLICQKQDSGVQISLWTIRASMCTTSLMWWLCLAREEYTKLISRAPLVNFNGLGIKRILDTENAWKWKDYPSITKKCVKPDKMEDQPRVPTQDQLTE